MHTAHVRASLSPKSTSMTHAWAPGATGRENGSVEKIDVPLITMGALAIRTASSQGFSDTYLDALRNDRGP